MLPLAVVGLFGFLARSTRERYEQSKPAGVVDYELDGRDPFQMHTEKARGIGRHAPWFWYGEPLARTLGRAHLAAGIAVIAWSLAAGAEALGGTSRFIGAGRGLAWLALALAVAVAAMCAPRPLGVRRWRWDLRGLVSVALVALALVAAGCWSRPASAGTSRTLPGLGDIVGIVFGTHLLLILALVVYSVVVAVAMWSRRRRPEPDMDADTLRCGPLAAVVLSTVTLNSLLAGLSVRTADALGRGVAIGSPTPGDPAPAIWYPRVYDLFAVGFVAGLLLVLVLVAIAWLTTGRHEPTDRIAAEDAILSALPRRPGPAAATTWSGASAAGSTASGAGGGWPSW